MKTIYGSLASVMLFVALTCEAHAELVVNEFRANLSAAVVQPQTPAHSNSTATAVAKLILSRDTADPEATTLSYDIQFSGLDVSPTDGANLFDDVTAIHFHDTTVCANASLCGDGMGGKLPGATAGTRHVLNILGAPRNDDANIEIYPDEERVAGLWDASDANDLTPAPSQSIADPAILELLLTGKLAVMVHTNLVPSGEIGGFVLPVPEPSAVTLLVAAIGVFATRCRCR